LADDSADFSTSTWKSANRGRRCRVQPS